MSDDLERSTNMMETLTTPVTGPSAWTRNDLENDRSLMIHLTSKQIRELQSAREALTQRNLPHSQVKKTHFPLPTLGRKLVWLQQDLEDGRGFAILRGVPTDCTIDDAALMWAGVAAHLGTTITLDTMGTRIEPVFDRGLSYDNIKVTGGYTNAALTPHCDSGDLLGLLCLRPAMSGGTTILSSAMTIFNEILAAHPEYLKPLFSGFHYNIRGKGPPGKGRNITLHRNPVYDYFKGRLSIRYNQKAIKTAEQLPGVERLTNLQKQAIDYVAEVASRPENSFRISLKAGDLALLNNNVILHTRTSFVDFDQPERKRLLLRAQIVMPNARKLRDEFADHFNTGPREGPYVQVTSEDELLSSLGVGRSEAKLGAH